MYYKIINGSVSFGADTILERIDIEIKDKEKIAIVGRNGCGKTTLLKALMGEVELEEGTGENTFMVSKSGGLSIGYLKQMVFEDINITFLEELEKSYKNVIEIEKKLNSLLEIMQTDSSEEIINQYSDLNDKFADLGGYTYKKEYLSIIHNMGFEDADLNRKLSQFSGGQKTKIAFIKLLLSKPDILLLDEPTNHLDVKAIEWLEGYLKRYNSALVIVSHDRMFLNNIVDKVYEIEYGETTCYSGNYESFEKQKKLNYEKQLKDHELQKLEINRLTRLIERFRYKATKAKMVQSKIKMLEKMKIINPPNRYDLKTFHSNFQPETSSYKNVLAIKNLGIGYVNDNPLAKLEFSLLSGDKLGIIGENGIGKSTLLKTLVGIIPALCGTCKFGENVNIGYFDQQLAEIDSSETILENFCEEYPTLSSGDARTKLGAFMFSGEDVFKPINTLSGGEKVRLALCKILGHRPNVLILDEPTNHLDIVGKETLENMLIGFKGTIIFVSHDRYFVNKVATKILAFEYGKTELFNGTYNEYKIEKAKLLENENLSICENIKQKDGVSSTNITSNNKQNKNSSAQSYAYLKELDKKKKRVLKLEEEITTLNNKASSLTQSTFMQEVYSSPEKYKDIIGQIEQTKTLIDNKESEWTKLMEELESYS